MPLLPQGAELPRFRLSLSQGNNVRPLGGGDTSSCCLAVLGQLAAKLARRLSQFRRYSFAFPLTRPPSMCDNSNQCGGFGASSPRPR